MEEIGGRHAIAPAPSYLGRIIAFRENNTMYRVQRLFFAAAFVILTVLFLGCGGGGNRAGGGGNLVGVWRAAFADPNFGPGQVELILQSNGQFQQQTAYQAGSLVTIFGTFRTLPGGILRLDIQRGEPTQFCGPLGCSPILYPAGETHSYSLPDNNALILQPVGCVPGTAVCQFNYQRVN
jgi:hypothetical protein